MKCCECCVPCTKSVFGHGFWKAFGRDGWTVLNIFVGELLGTAFLVFFGCIVGVPLSSFSPATANLATCFVFGAVIGSCVSIFAHISGSHINPAVTLCALIMRTVNPLLFVVYLVAQVLGGIAGYGTILLVSPSDLLTKYPELCVTTPNEFITDIQGAAVEAIATGFLILIVCAVWDQRNSHNTDCFPIKFHLCIFTLAAAVGAYTGASMNPARSLGPALWTSVWRAHWVYWVGPLLGSAVCSFLYRLLFNNQELAAAAAGEATE